MGTMLVIVQRPSWGTLDSPSEAPQIPKNWTQNTEVQKEDEVGRMHRSGETVCVQGIWAFLLARA